QGECPAAPPAWSGYRELAQQLRTHTPVAQRESHPVALAPAARSEMRIPNHEKQEWGMGNQRDAVTLVSHSPFPLPAVLRPSRPRLPVALSGLARSRTRRDRLPPGT